MTMWRPGPGTVDLEMRQAELRRGYLMGTEISSSNANGANEERELLETIPLFSSLSPGELDQVVARCSRLQLAAGEWLIREGEPAEALYIVLHGRLQALGGEAWGRKMSRGHVLGEIAMLTGQVRTTGVQAVRDSELLVLNRADFEQLANSHPGWVRQVAQIVVGHLTTAERQEESQQVLTLGIFGLDGSAAASEIALQLYRRLAAHDSTAFVGSRDAPPRQERARWAHELEHGHRYVLYDACSQSEEWRRWCRRHSDHIVLIADARATPGRLAFDPGELTLGAEVGNTTMVLLHPQSARRPASMNRWLQAVGRPAHLHLRKDNQEDLARMARLLTGRGYGLVLGGGGPRGFAHLGVLKAIDEAGIPVDMIGGTSIGAIVGALRALDLDDAARQRLATRFVNSGNVFLPTLPVLSLSSARRVRRLLEGPDYFGDLQIEDCWLPYFCVSANLTRAEIVVHDSGSLATAVRASLSLPGVFPPVRSGQDFLVDGGVLNNLPVDVMRKRQGSGAVIAVDLSVKVEVGAPPGYNETPSGWTLLAERLVGRNRSTLPLAHNVLMRAKDLAGIQAQRQLLAANMPDLMIHPDVAGFGMFDYKGAKALVDVGYRHAHAQLEASGWLHSGS